jgi:elongation factor 1-beta
LNTREEEDVSRVNMVKRMLELIELNPVLLTKEEQEALAAEKERKKVVLKPEDEKKISEYEKKLAKQNWFGGAKPSQSDKEAISFFKNVNIANCVDKFPNTYGWLSYASKFTDKIQESWPKDEVEDECDDLFASDDENDEASFDALCKAKQAAIDKANSKKKAIAKSIVMFEVKPLESETDLDVLFQRILKECVKEGCDWK